MIDTLVKRNGKTKMNKLVSIKTKRNARNYYIPLEKITWYKLDMVAGVNGLLILLDVNDTLDLQFNTHAEAIEGTQQLTSLFLTDTNQICDIVCEEVEYNEYE